MDNNVGMAQRYEKEIPEGYEARIEGNKVIFEQKESDDERIRQAIESIIRVYGKTQGEWLAGYDMDTLVAHLRDAFACLEKQKEQQPLSTEETKLNSIAFLEQMGYTCIPPGKELKPAGWSEEDERILTGIIERGSSQIPSQEPALRGEQMEWLMKRLKSLRPQPHWKPSEEQMKFLKRTVDGWDITCRGQGALESLYVDLQKLLES